MKCQSWKNNKTCLYLRFQAKAQGAYPELKVVSNQDCTLNIPHYSFMGAWPQALHEAGIDWRQLREDQIYNYVVTMCRLSKFDLVIRSVIPA